MDGVGQERHEAGQGVTAPIHGQVLENLSGQHEQGDDQGGDPLADDGGRGDGQEHGQLHAHAPPAQVAPGLGDDRPAAHQQGAGADNGDEQGRGANGAGQVDADRARADQGDAGQIGALDAGEIARGRARGGREHGCRISGGHGRALS